MLLSKCRAKCPIITIYITPWLQLQEKNTGWDVDIENENSLVEPIQQAAAWSQDAFNNYCNASFQLAHEYINNSQLTKGYNELFGEN